MSVLYGSCLCGGVKYAIAGTAVPAAALPLLDVPQSAGRRISAERGSRSPTTCRNARARRPLNDRIYQCAA
jgi:hypothetical protein